MGRKSLAAERRAQILDAFAVCLRKYGMEGCTLEKVAQEAGVQRSIIRHYIGNRDDLVTAAVTHIADEYVAELAESFDNLPHDDRIPELLDFLFDPEVNSDLSDFDTLMNALWTSQERHSQTRELLLNLHLLLENLIFEALTQVYPDSDTVQRRETAYGVMCLCDSTWSMLSLGFPQSRATMARSTAEQLIERLTEDRS